MALTFDANYYLTHRADVFQAFVATGGSSGLSWPQFAEQHYNNHGRFEGANPNAIFNTNEYLAANPDVAAAGVNPFQHYLTHGVYEGRAPSASFPARDAFDWETYVAANPDLADAGIDTPEEAYAHFVLHGQFEGRPGTPAVVPGQTFTLTTDADTLTGTAGDDTFEASLASGAGGLVSQQTLQGFDKLDGGEGNDTLNAELNGFDSLFGAANPTITNIEQYNLTVSADSAAGGLDLARASGYEVLQNINSRGDLFLDNVNVSEDGDAPTIALTNVRGDTRVTYDVEVDSVSVQNVTASKVGLHDDAAYLSIDVDSGQIETLNLDVSNGVYLELGGDADRIQNLNISGSGILELEGGSDFSHLETLNSTGYTGDLELDVSGSAVLVSVKTGVGDDNVLVSKDAVNGDLSVDMGEGENALRVDDADDDVDLSNLDFTGGVANVQTLAIDDDVLLSNDATLDLTGFDENLATVLFDEGLDGDGYQLAVTSPNADLALVSNGDFEDVDLHTVGVQNLTVNVTNLNGRLDIDNLSGAELETLTLNQTNGDGAIWLDIESDADHDVSALQSITATAAGDASVEIDASGPDADVNSLTTINVKAAGDARVELQGVAGQPFVAGVQQVQGLNLTTSAGVGSGLLNPRVTSGQVTFASDLFPGGILTIPYQTSTSILNNTAAVHTAGAINDIIAVLNAGNYGFTASSNAAGKIILTWDEASDEQHPAINIINVAPLTEGVQGTLSAGLDAAANVPGSAEVPMEPGTGFEALTDIVVDAAEDAEVDLTDVYGDVDGFTVNATAVEDVDVWLNNTGATEVTVSAGADAYIDVWGDTYGNRDLVSITVVADEAYVWLADDLASFDVLDVSNVATYVMVDASLADFGSLALGEFITYEIGATTDVDFTTNVAREVFNFVADDIGNVVITDFTWGNDPVAGDRLDLSAFASNAGQLVFSDVGSDLVITDLTGGLSDFGGSITIVGAAGHAADVAAFNIIYG